MLHAVQSPVVQKWVASAVVELPLAVPGISGLTAGGHAARTSSPPVLNNRSLYVSPQRHTWAERGSPQFPPLVLPA